MLSHLFWSIHISQHISLVLLPRSHLPFIFFFIEVLLRWLRLRGLLRLLSEKRGLQGEGVHDVELAEDHDTCCRFFAFLDAETTICEFEVIWRLVATEKGHHANLGVLNPSFVLVVLIGASIEKGVLLSGMTMQVAIHQDPSFIMHVPNEMFCIKYSRV